MKVGCGFDGAVALQGPALVILGDQLAGHGPAATSVAALSRTHPRQGYPPFMRVPGAPGAPAVGRAQQTSPDPGCVRAWH
jgi:hypothetical protein